MEFYIHNKDDQKLSTLVNLGTVFKFDETNYIVYYNKQVEKSMIDIYIGKISYGDNSLVISKIDKSKQSEFLQIIKEILSNKNPETEISDYAKIIDTATIILDGVQKIQIPTISLENLKNYHNIEKEVYGNNLDVNNEEEINNVVPDTDEVKSDLTANNNGQKENKYDNELSIDEMVPETRKDIYDKQNNKNLNILDEDNKSIVKSDNSYINPNSNISNLDNLLNERENKKNKDTKKAINTPLLIILIITIVVAIVLYILGQNV